jgi:predicted dehydrogenase
VVDIVGTSGRISVPVPFNTFVDVPATFTVVDNLGPRQVEFPASNAYGLMMDAFARAILEQKPLPIAGWDAIQNMQVMDAITASANSGGWESI